MLYRRGPGQTNFRINLLIPVFLELKPSALLLVIFHGRVLKLFRYKIIGLSDVDEALF